MSGETTRIVATPTLSRFKGRHPNHYLRKCAIGFRSEKMIQASIYGLKGTSK